MESGSASVSLSAIHSPSSSYSSESDISVSGLSQGGSIYFIPTCDDALKPVVSIKFRTLDQAIEFYKVYALECGFGVRRGGDRKEGNVIVLKYLHSSKQGYKTGDNNIKHIQRCPSSRVGCKARLTLTYIGSQGYKIIAFEPRHTHTFVVGHDKQFMKSMRKLDFEHKKFVMDCEKAYISPVRSHRIFKELVGASVVDFKNFRRDMLAYIGGSDAQMTINKFSNKKNLSHAFCFDYDVDSCGRLTRLFWADPMSRKNFSLFGNVVSFNATYRTNRFKSSLCCLFLTFFSY
ncbi:hypothetical protein V2J09_014737 [Rumex salicifolius]